MRRCSLARSAQYHNRVHAADVLQWTHVLMQRGGVLRALSVGDAGVLGVYLSAIVHDLNHCGLNNDYLVRSNDALALLYNDQSPMENHHLAHCSALLKLEEYDFLHAASDRVSGGVWAGRRWRLFERGQRQGESRCGHGKFREWGGGCMHAANDNDKLSEGAHSGCAVGVDALSIRSEGRVRALREPEGSVPCPLRLLPLTRAARSLAGSRVLARPSQVKQTLRKQIIKMVLATDMKQHFTQVALFK